MRAGVRACAARLGAVTEGGFFALRTAPSNDAMSTSDAITIAAQIAARTYGNHPVRKPTRLLQTPGKEEYGASFAEFQRVPVATAPAPAVIWRTAGHIASAHAS
jgi:hypothetical protein